MRILATIRPWWRPLARPARTTTALAAVAAGLALPAAASAPAYPKLFGASEGRSINLGIAHAILIVYVGSVARVCDNQIEDIIRADEMPRYEPCQSISEDGWWLHRW